MSALLTTEARLALCFVLVCLQACVTTLACVLCERRLRAQQRDTDNLRARIVNLEEVRISGLVLPAPIPLSSRPPQQRAQMLPPPCPEEAPDRRLTQVWRQG